MPPCCDFSFVTWTLSAGMCDMRVPLTFDLEDCRLVTESLRDVAEETLSQIRRGDPSSFVPSPE